MKPVEGVMVRMADPTKVTTWWVACSRKDAAGEVAKVAYWFAAWFREHGIAAQFGTSDGATFTPAEDLDLSGLKV